jgi:DHA3 family macrolide efflux protein-like MFS transporter
MGRLRYRELLKIPTFFRFFVGMMITNLGNGLFLTTITLFALHLGATPFELGVIGFCTILPRIVLGPIGGVYADRWNRLIVIQNAEWIRAALLLAIFIFYHTVGVSVWGLILLSTAITMVSPFHVAACKAYIPDIVESRQIGLANGLLQTVIWPAFFFGAGMIGPFQQWIGLPQIFALNAGFFILAAMILHTLPAPGSLSHSNRSLSLIRHLGDGYQALRTETTGFVWSYPYL